uniref:Sulfatase domain-containing protein n=1 Tax=Panagrellus redivivus TaxID=6233 RepID=A0A7E5A299_PANRE
MRFTVFIIVALTVVSLVVLFIDNATINPFISDYAFSRDVEEVSEKPCSFSSSDLQTRQNEALPPPLSSDNFIPKEPQNYSNIIFDNCELPHLNPWDPSISKYLKPNTKKKSCKSTFKLLTKLEKGVLTKTLNDSKTTCSYRCLHPVNDYTLKYGDWQNITDTATPACDIVETKCFKNDASSNAPFYEFMHAQIYRNDTAKPDERPKHPDVHVIIIDSVSHSQFVRALPRTYHELIANYEAIPFPHLNKIAVNSRPNALAMFLGKSHRNIEKSPMSVGYSSDFKGGADCKKGLDDDQWVGKFFKQSGYRTLISDDWALGTFNWPNCKGFMRKATDHVMKPFQLRSRGKKFYNKKIDENVYGGVCKESYETIMDYLDKFIEVYPDKPKFSITWSIDIAHNDNNQLYHADGYYHNFFRKNEAKLNNSFVFVMGDHGLRFGGIRNTQIGEIEDNNPFLLLSLPWSLRRNAQTMSTVRDNALQLITHYDLYATYVDLAQPKINTTLNSTKLIVHGSSLLRPLPQPRTCDRLRVPFEYCMCIRTKTKLPKDNTVGKPAALKMVAQMNQVIKTEASIKNICTPLKLNENATITVEQFKSEGSLNIYQVTYSVLPGDGKFWGYVGQASNSSDIRIISARFPRLNSYDKTAFCAKSSAFTAYCYCKSLIKS